MTPACSTSKCCEAPIYFAYGVWVCLKCWQGLPK